MTHSIRPGETQGEALARLASFSTIPRAGDGYDQSPPPTPAERKVLVSLVAVFLIGLFIGLLVGGVIGWVASPSRISTVEKTFVDQHRQGW